MKRGYGQLGRPGYSSGSEPKKNEDDEHRGSLASFDLDDYGSVDVKQRKVLNPLGEVSTHYARRGRPSPKYDVRLDGGTWRCLAITFENKEFKAYGTTKKDAKQNAAYEVLAFIEQRTSKAFPDPFFPAYQVESRCYVTVARETEDVSLWIERKVYKQEHKHVFFDSEWPPNRIKGFISPVYWIALAVDDECLLAHRRFFEESSVFKRLFQHNGVKKIGHGVSGDIKALNVCFRKSSRVNNVVELTDNLPHPEEWRGSNTPLGKLTEEYLGTSLSKNSNVTRSRWDTVTLTAQQQQYLIADVCVLMDIYNAAHARE